MQDNAVEPCFDVTQYRVSFIKPDCSTHFLFVTRPYHKFNNCDAFARMSLEHLRKAGVEVGDFEHTQLFVSVAVGKKWHRIDGPFAVQLGEAVVAVKFTLLDKTTHQHQFLVESTA